ncbi:ABC transporter substrate-binding protein [Virgibacillus soli]|uniref:ABC transporter substrate-binding protein n=1 Tax=Paracerasibacillus soli TaxID=480284 RepID=UPI0035E76519
MRTITDHLGREITFPYPPKRIVSLVPAITETMYHLQLAKEIVGRTRFCIFPKDKIANAVNIGGTKEIKLHRIQSLQPDLIIAEKEENTQEIVETLEQYFPVYVFEIQTIDDVLRMITDLGDVTNRQNQASKLSVNIQTAFSYVPNLQAKRVAYVIWRNPYMVVGKDTYIQSVLEKLGFINPFTSLEGRYPIVTIEDFERANLDYIFLATEPFPFQEKHFAEFRVMDSKANLKIIDGEMFWYGAKMIEAAAYFRKEFANGV